MHLKSYQFLFDLHLCFFGSTSVSIFQVLSSDADEILTALGKSKSGLLEVCNLPTLKITYNACQKSWNSSANFALPCDFPFPPLDQCCLVVKKSG